MKYYMLTVDRNISNAISFENPDQSLYESKASRIQYNKAPKMTVVYYKNSPEVEKPDILLEPFLCVSERTRHLLQAYEPELRMKGIRCYPEEVEDPQSEMYWWPYVTEIDCVSVETEKYPTGLIRHLVLDGRKIQGKTIFRVAGLLETVFVVSLELAESMLRRNLWGMELVPVEVRGVTHEEVESITDIR